MSSVSFSNSTVTMVADLREKANILNPKKLDIHLKRFDQIAKSEEVFNLRKTIYHEELGDIPVGSVIDEDDAKAIHLLAYYENNLVSAVRFLPAMDSKLLQSEKQLEGSVWCVGRLMIRKQFRGSSLVNLLVYYMSSFLRSQGCEKSVSFYPRGRNYSTQRVYKAKPLSIIRHHKLSDGAEVEIQLYHFPELEWMTYKSFSLLRGDDWREVAIEQAAIPCLKKFILAKIDHAYGNLWFQKVRAKTLTMDQYIDTLGNNLKFVQWTTRILAAIASMTADRSLRNHYLGHLRGEVDHDLWIEEDLEYLGADVKYYRDHKVPEPAIADFMNCQESLVSHYRSPIHFIALPLTIEGFTAFWRPEDMQDLKECVRLWGYSDADKATKFYSSHIHTDGKAEVGHWHQTFKLLPLYVRSEYDISRMYQIASCVSSAIDRAFERFASKKSLG